MPLSTMFYHWPVDLCKVCEVLLHLNLVIWPSDHSKWRQRRLTCLGRHSIFPHLSHCVVKYNQTWKKRLMVVKWKELPPAICYTGQLQRLHAVGIGDFGKNREIYLPLSSYCSVSSYFIPNRSIIIVWQWCSRHCYW